MSAFYKICSNISEVIKNHDNDCEKYKLIIMKSGTEDLFESTLYLLKTNRMKIAQQEARAELMAETNAPA